MKRIFVVGLFALATASRILAVNPGREVYLPSVGHGQGACAGSVCSQWRSDAWAYNPSPTHPAQVTIYLLDRKNTNNGQSEIITIAPGETKEFKDIVLSTFNKDGVYGAVRFSSDIPIVVTGRIYDDNVVTNIGSGTAGQFFAGLPAEQAIGLGQSTDLIGLAQDEGGIWRTNYGFVEITGNPVTVVVELLDAKGVVLASWQNGLAPRAAQQFALAKFPGNPSKGINQRVRARVSEGSGKFLAFASRVDNRTGDPSTVEMSTTAGAGGASIPMTGRFEGAVLKGNGDSPNGGIKMMVSDSAITSFEILTGIPCSTDESSVTVDLDGANAPLDLAESFTMTLPAQAYAAANGTTAFSTVFTLSGSRNAEGGFVGTLTSVTSGGTNKSEFDYSKCNGTVSGRSWRANWTSK